MLRDSSPLLEVYSLLPLPLRPWLALSPFSPLDIVILSLHPLETEDGCGKEGWRQQSLSAAVPNTRLSLGLHGRNRPAASQSTGIWGHLSVMTWRKHLVGAQPGKTLASAVSSWEARQTMPQAVSSTGWLGGEEGALFLRASSSAMDLNGTLSLRDLEWSSLQRNLGRSGIYGFEPTDLLSLCKPCWPCPC